MISKKVFAADGSNQRFLSDFIIRSEQFTRVYNYVYDAAGVDGDIDVATGLFIRVADTPASADLVTIDKWDLVDNSISFYTSPSDGSRVYIEVATTAEEFGDTLIQPSVERAEEAADASEASAGDSAISAGESATSATASASSATASAASATASAASATDSASSATDSASSATDSAASATVSTNKATFSATSATDSATSATASANSATSSATSATDSANSATSAATSATNSANSASTATTAATASATSASEAATSAASINLPTIGSGDAGKILEVNVGENGYDLVAQAESASNVKKNLLINGAFNIWSRGDSVDCDKFEYGADRFYNVGATRLMTKVAGDASLSTYANELEGGTGLTQIVENGGTLYQGQSLTLSFWITDYTAAWVKAAVQTVTSSGTTINSFPHSMTATGETVGSYSRYSLTVTCPTPVTTDVHLAVAITSISADRNIANVQLEVGPLTDFEEVDPEEEYEICKKYFYRYDGGTTGLTMGVFTASSSEIRRRFEFPLPSTMRVAPTVSNITSSVGTVSSQYETRDFVRLTCLDAGDASAAVLLLTADFESEL